MIKNDYPPEFYIQQLKEGNTFSFTRWGDGEWLCVTGAAGRNTDKHEYFPEMAESLRKALREDKGYYKAIWPITHRMLDVMSKRIEDFVSNNEVKADWVNAIVWEDLVLKKGVGPLVAQLESMNFVIVSEPSKRALPIKYSHYIDIPAINCFKDRERIKAEMIAYCNSNPGCVFGMSASMATNVIVDELYDAIGDKCWMIDFGSLWEPFIGKKTRSHHAQYISKKL